MLIPTPHRRNTPRHAGSALERLEPRQFLSVSQPNFADFSSTTGLANNGFNGNAVTSGNSLELTNGLNNTARSVWWSQAVPISHFTTHFSYTTDHSSNNGDGFTFTIQNASTSAVGGSGANLGYGGGSIGASSVALAFNIYNSGNYGSAFGVVSGGGLPNTITNVSPVDLHNGDTYNVTAIYDGSTLSITMTDASDSSKTFHTTSSINIPQIIGASNALVGFTAATGTSVADQKISEWDYSGTNGPTVATPAAATPSTTSSTTSSLSVLGDDGAGESALTYTWTTTLKPGGAQNPSFSNNGNNAAKANTVTFHKDGTYHLRCTITNSLGQTTVSNVTVVVAQTATADAAQAKHQDRQNAAVCHHRAGPIPPRDANSAGDHMERRQRPGQHRQFHRPVHRLLQARPCADSGGRYR